jgi:hypothetical protein
MIDVIIDTARFPPLWFGETAHRRHGKHLIDTVVNGSSGDAYWYRKRAYIMYPITKIKAKIAGYYI